MRFCIGVVCALVLGSSDILAQETGQKLFEQRCASCHVSPPPGSRAPTLDQLRAATPESVLDSMTTGSMAPMTSGLDVEQRRLIATHITGRGFGLAAPADAASMPNRCDV